MASGKRVKRGKYTGNGSATAREIVTDFKPGKINFISAEGQAFFAEHHPVFKKIAGGAPTALADGAVVAEELKFKIASTDDSLNKNNVVYYYEAEE